MKSIRSDPCWHRGCRNYWQNGTKREDEDARCLGRYISTISRVARWKSPSRHSARKIVSGLTIQSHVPLPTRPPLLRAFQEFSRAEFLLIYDTFAMPLTRQVACICELFFFFFFLSLLFFSHNRTPRCHEKGGGGNFNAIDRSVADTFAPDWFDSRRIFESCWMCGCRSWYRYESGEIISVKRLEDCYRLWDKAL